MTYRPRTDAWAPVVIFVSYTHSRVREAAFSFCYKAWYLCLVVTLGHVAQDSDSVSTDERGVSGLQGC